jgi:beta-glucosidase
MHTRHVPSIALLTFMAAAPWVCAGADQAATDAAVRERVDALVRVMTLEEKAGQLNQLASGALTGPERIGPNGGDLIAQGLVGSMLNVVGAPEVNAVQKQVVEGSRLHIPLLFGLDVIHGFRTVFPIPLGLSASWDPDLVERTARRAATEASSQGIRWTFSPMVDIARDARWGRIAEGSGEDPYLGQVFARAYVRGYQGRDLSDPTAILACAKHFVGYGAAEGGREYNTTEISERTLRDVYLPPFRAAVDEGVATVMSAFNSLDGIPASANPGTINGILKGEWGFGGFVVSDWTSVRETIVHGIADDEVTATLKGFSAGVDMDMQSNLYLPYLPALVRQGRVPQATLDEAVRRVLLFKARLGLLDHPYTDLKTAQAPLVNPQSRSLARTAAEESFVLLKNGGGGSAVLPLKPAHGTRIALIGPLAARAKDMLGPWYAKGDESDVVTLRDALEARAKRDGFTVHYAEGAPIDGNDASGIAGAVAVASRSDVVILAVGEKGTSSGEAGARADIGLPGSQEALLEAVVGTGKPVVLVAFSGRPLALSWAAEHAGAVLMAWFPGIEAGPALVETLMGDVEPTGRLTASMPRAVGQEPIYYNTLSTGRPRNDPIAMGGVKPDPYYVSGYIDLPNTPLYPFGAGLGYTSFSVTNPKVDTASLSARALNAGSGSLKVTAVVTNTGSRRGTTVAQLYIRQRGTSVARPVRELKGFSRVTLSPGESREVSFTLVGRDFAFWNASMTNVAEPASLYVWVSLDSVSGTPERVTISE